MAKITIDIDYVKKSLSDIGYVISDCLERENNGTNWQIKFSNSGASVTIYDTNNKKNTVVNGKLEENEKDTLKKFIDQIKCKELELDPINATITDLIMNRHENFYYDFKQEWHHENGNLVHDILCLSNNIENRDSYLIFGVTDDYEVVGVENFKKSNELFDLLKGLKFAGDHIPNVELKKVYFKYKKIDVLVCKKSRNVPFFLLDRYRNVNPYQIYTRVGDTNTPINGNASYKDVERLWEIHFKDKGVD